MFSVANLIAESQPMLMGTLGVVLAGRSQARVSPKLLSRALTVLTPHRL
jgi:hypothetical protein